MYSRIIVSTARGVNAMDEEGRRKEGRKVGQWKGISIHGRIHGSSDPSIGSFRWMGQDYLPAILIGHITSHHITISSVDATLSALKAERRREKGARLRSGEKEQDVGMSKT